MGSNPIPRTTMLKTAGGFVRSTLSVLSLSEDLVLVEVTDELEAGVYQARAKKKVGYGSFCA
jgi:hypothetical protein